MKTKRKILFVGEASYIATGFGTYYNEVLKRLYQRDEFEIFELGSYAHDGDQRNYNVPWKFYPVAPNPNDQEGNRIYSSCNTNQFGEWRFADVCIDCKPDIVVDIRDFWMCEFIERSPFRKYFTEIFMPTIDGEPQKQMWLDTYSRADQILTYSEYGMNLVKNTGRKNTPLVTIASPGADIDMFRPVENKKKHKQKLGIPPDALIVGTVMRNQKRKLYKDLIEAFAQWLHRSKTKGHIDLARKTFLYLHTSYPDVGYDIGTAVQEFNISNKVIMTYLCTNCKTAFPYRFGGSTVNCLKCGQSTAHPPNANHQCPRDILSDIMNTFDVYVQYSICEGFGMPLAEAQSCGVPTMAVDYSAMEDHLKCPTSIPIKVGRFFYEAVIETEQKRALPDNLDFVNKLDRFLKLSETRREELSKQTRSYITEDVETFGTDQKMPRRSWDRTAEIWYNVLKSCEIKNRLYTWNCKQVKVYKPDMIMPKNNMDNLEFTRWVITKIWNRPEFTHSYFEADWASSLDTGYKHESGRRIQMNRQQMVKFFLTLNHHENEMEEKRVISLSAHNNEGISVVEL